MNDFPFNLLCTNFYMFKSEENENQANNLTETKPQALGDDLQSDIAECRRQNTVIKDDIDLMKSTIENLKHEMTLIKNRQLEIEGELKKLKNKNQID